ncbi:ICP0-binding domain of ubiquitin-specific protease 7 [Mycena sanguinolenta]|nr:ICP0-binding domain of ubiquitin-specific protease 7 [Mycena sanguinolenta]
MPHSPSTMVLIWHCSRKKTAGQHPTYLPSRYPGTFRSRAAKHFGYFQDRIRLWAIVERQNKTLRVEGLIPESAGTLRLDRIQKNMCSARRNDLPLYLEILSETKSGRPPDSIMIFLKHFHPFEQALRGVGQVHILQIKTEKIGDLVAFINERMGWPPSTLLKLYQEIEPTKVKIMEPRLTFYQSEIQDGDIICFQADISQDDVRKLEWKGLHSNPISHYDFLHNCVMILFKPGFNESNADSPEFTLVLSKKVC